MLLFNVEYNLEEQKVIILDNIKKMLIKRNILTLDYKLPEIKNNIIDILTHENIIIQIIFINNKINIDQILDNFLKKDNHKIIIAKEIQNKVYKDILNNYNNVEIFLESYFLEDISTKIFIPEHQLLNNEEKKELLSMYNEHTLPSIHIDDPMAKYYNAKIGDIFRIIRPSFTSGKNITYRKVINMKKTIE